MADGLHDDEQAVQRERGDGGERQLRGRRTPGPGALVVNVGSTRLSVASVATVASAVAVPSALNDATRWRSAPTSSDSPTMPLQVIITAANTVSRASVAVSGRRRPSA